MVNANITLMMDTINQFKEMEKFKIESMSKMSQENLFEVLKLDPKDFKYMPQSIELAKEAVKLNPMNAQFVKYDELLPNENEKKEFIKTLLELTNGNCFGFLPNIELLDFNVLNWAVTINGMNLSYIPNRTPEIEEIAVYQNPVAINFIEDPSEKLQLYAIEKDWMLIDCIMNPTEKVMMRAIELSPMAYNFIKLDKIPDKVEEYYNIFTKKLSEVTETIHKMNPLIKGSILKLEKSTDVYKKIEMILNAMNDEEKPGMIFVYTDNKMYEVYTPPLNDTDEISWFDASVILLNDFGKVTQIYNDMSINKVVLYVPGELDIIH